MEENIVMETDLQSKINSQASESQNNMLWGKPANDILNGRDSSASAKPIRAIWEMVQNARDVSQNKCNIIFIRRHGSFIFKHDGMPFTNDTLNALILQTSSKVRNDGDQVGQYGTGFLTTHKFGRKFNLSGALRLVNDKELYYNFPKLEIDRTPNTREEMVSSLAKQFEEKDRWLEDLTNRDVNPSEWTTFTYLQPNDIEEKNVEEALEQAPGLIPYVLCLNESIKSITIQDEILNHTISFSRGEKKHISETSKATLYSTIITVNGQIKEDIIIQTLESKKTVTSKKGIPKTMVTVILPISNNKVFWLGRNVARMFIYLPLVGTEEWGFNFILQAPMFTCSTDDRNSLRLIVDGQTEEDPATNNRIYIDEATDIIFDYISQHSSEWEDVHYLAPIYFDIANANKELSDYYKTLKIKWLQKMRNLDIVYNGVIYKKPSDIYVVDSMLAKAVENNDKLLNALHRVISNKYPGAIPIPDQLGYWSNVFSHWYENETCRQVLGINDIVNHIVDKGMAAVSETDLLTICKYLCESEQVSFFDENILLTEDGILTNKTEGYKQGAFGSKLKASIKELLPEQTRKFVKETFADLVKLPLFDNKDIKEALSSCTESLQIKIKIVSDAAKLAWETHSTAPSTDGLLNEKQRIALMDYCRMVIPESSIAFQAKALDLIREYYDYKFDYTNKIDTDFFEWRGAIRTLLCNVLTEFTLLNDDEKLAKVDWIKRLITCIYDFSDFSGMLQNYRIYLSQNKEFCYCKDLKKDTGIPEKMKDVYNILMSTSEIKLELRKRLFDADFGKIAHTDAVCEVVLLGKDIMDEIQKSGKYLSEIDSYEHKDLIMDIINNFDGEDGALWKNAFETIYKDIPSLLAKLVLNKENREPMIKIMKIKDKDRLNKAAEIIEDENLITIWNLGKSIWQEKQNAEADFEKKKELGEYVEEYLRKELRDELAGYELKVNIDNMQGGQDIIISINDKPIYYIEVKSRWITADSVMMSATQLDRSVEKKECYSLFAVDMVGFNGENVKEHIYPKSIDDFVHRIRVVDNIGYLNDEITPSKRDPNEEVHIGGDYKVIVPQNLIARNHISYMEFIDQLKNKVRDSISKL